MDRDPAAPPYEAVILAAGRGSRLGQRSEEIPKALLPLGPRAADDPTETSLLRRQCELMHAAGVERIIVVVGYLRQQLFEAIDSWGITGVSTVVNPTPEICTSGSLHSFQFAVRAGVGVLDGSRQTLLVDADIVYHHRMLDLLLEAPAETSVLVCAGVCSDNEEVRVYGTLERPRFLGKGLTSALVGGEPCLGEATGIIKLAPADHALVRQTIDWMLGDPDASADSAVHQGFGPARQATEHEELTQRLMHYGRIRTVRFSGAELPFMEVDSEEEYGVLRDEFYPRLLELEQEGRR